MKKIITVAFPFVLLISVINWMGCSKDDGQDDNNVPPTGLLEGAFDSITTYPEPAEITYITQEGKLVTTEIFPGQIMILVSGPSAVQVKDLVTKNGGKIVVQVPKAGHYMATIDPLKTNIFLKAMYESPLVKFACPNRPCIARGDVRVSANWIGSMGSEAELESAGGKFNSVEIPVLKSTVGDQGSIIQTVDVENMIGCDQLSHLDAVALIAGKSGTGVNTNDVSIDIYGRTDMDLPFRKTIELIEYSYIHKTPVVINLSIGGDDDIPGAPLAFYQFMCHALDSISGAYPNILDYAVVMMACTNNMENETQEINSLISIDPGSLIWKHLYFVGADEGAAGCTTPGEGAGYADPGTGNYLSAPACNQPIPNTTCTATGNSAAVPQVSGVVAKTYELLKQDNNTMPIADIAEALWNYQKLYSGNLPTPEQLVAFISGVVQIALYDGTWNGTFNYTASVPQEEGPNVIINTSFTLSFTLKSEVSLPGYPHLLRFQSVTCSDPRFGATMAVIPDQQLSMAFLPGSYGSQSEEGMALIIEFPNGSVIMTNNSYDGSFSIDPTGTIIASSYLVENDAFLAGTGIGDPNNPVSGPGQYAYNWCIFRNWSLKKVL